MPGAKSIYLDECLNGNFIGVDFGINEDLAEHNQNVKGVIIGFDDDLKIKRALSVTTNIDFYKYKVDFKLYK